jgi:hypothetical protein
MFIPIPFHAKRTPAVEEAIDRVKHLYPERRHGRQHIRDICLLVDMPPKTVIRAMLCLNWKPPANRLENGYWEAPPETIPPSVQRVMASLQLEVDKLNARKQAGRLQQCSAEPVAQRPQPGSPSPPSTIPTRLRDRVAARPLIPTP